MRTWREHTRRRAAAALALAWGVLAAAAPALAEQAEHPSLTQADRWWNALWALGLFAVLLLVLRRFAWKPVMRAVQDREQAIADTLADAERRQREAGEALDEYRQRLTLAETEALSLMEKTRRQAQAESEEILAAARTQAAAEAQRAKDELERARREAMEGLYESTAELAAELAGKIIRREVRPEDHQQLIREVVAGLKEQSH